MGSGIAWNNCLSFEIFDDEGENFFGIIIGIATGDFDKKIESLFGFLEHRDCRMHSTCVSGMGDLPESDFLLCISHNMVPLAPEVTHLGLGRLREMNQDTQPRIGNSFGYLSFVKAVFRNRNFEIVLPHLCRDGARVYEEMFSRDDFFIEKPPD